jgi:hypothetical protein
VVEPQVKVQSAAVDMVTGKTPASPVGEVETLVVQVLGIFFFVLLTEGLVLAGSVSVVGCCCCCSGWACLKQVFFGEDSARGASADTRLSVVVLSWCCAAGLPAR